MMEHSTISVKMSDWVIERRPMIELLFARLPKELQLHAIKQLARFVATSTLASVTNEASLICNAAAWAAPETTVELLLKPLLGRIEDEVKHEETTGTGRMSKVWADIYSSMTCRLCVPYCCYSLVILLCAHLPMISIYL